LQSIIWENESIVKDISKLCLADQLEISGSMYSNYVPFSLDFENKILNQQIKRSSHLLKEMFPKEYIKGFYPPFSVYDDRNADLLIDESYQYIIVDWSVLDRTLNKNPIGDIHPSFSRAFKLKNKDIYILPSYNLRSVYRLFPKFYEQYLSSGIIDSLTQAILDGDEISKEEGINLFGILTIDLNDLRFPDYRSDFSFDSFFTESKQILKQPMSFIKPSEIIDKFDVQEIELKYSLPYEMTLSAENTTSLNISPCTENLNKLVKINLNRIRRIEESLDTIEMKDSQFLTNLIGYSWNYLLTNTHNTYFSQLTEPIKGVNILDYRSIWTSINHLNLVEQIVKDFTTKDTSNFGFLNIDSICGDMIYQNEKFLISFLHRGGSISNLVDLSNGEFVVSSPSSILCVNHVTQEPNFGLMFDIISKKFSGQYNLFNEGYVVSTKELNNGTQVTLSTYVSGDIVLKKIFTIMNNSNKIDITYSFENRGILKEEFSLYSVSKFNLGDYIEPIFSKEDIVIENKEGTEDSVILEIKNKKTSTKIKITLPQEIEAITKKSFRNLELTLRMKVPILNINEKKDFNFNLEIE
jgi:hypothetical protein